MNSYEQNPVLLEVPMPNTELKKWLVDYVGSQHGPSNGDVTVEMIIETVSKEFPEFLLSVAEENFFRGYEQALVDLQEASSSENE
tara:strand:+ start:1567 stop:1821 length:255 start_codon:yes stop_codon:yes gene_type:complete